MKKIGLVLVMVVCINPVSAQNNFEYKNVSRNLMTYYFEGAERSSAILEKIKKGYDASAYLPPNSFKNGKIDYTENLQKAIDEHAIVTLPNFPIMISPNGLKLRSNSIIYFQQNSKLIIKPNSRDSYKGLYIDGVENIKVYFASIEGDRQNHQSTEGQWGMGIWINNSSNIELYAPYITNCWGDGIYIGNKNKQSSSNIIVQNAFLDNNRRNGISITSGSNITINNSIISNTNGQNPRSGIDIEPNTQNDLLQNIKLKNIITYNNGMHGIVISPGNLNGKTTMPISITIDNHRDYYSTIGLGISITRENLKYLKPISGTVNVFNSTYKSSKLYSIKNYKGENNNVKLLFRNVSVGNYSSKINEEVAIETLFKNFNNNTQYTIK